MSNAILYDEDDSDTILDLITELTTDLDMNHDTLDGSHIRLTVAAIAVGRALLLRRGSAVPDDVDATLAKFDQAADGDGFQWVSGIVGGTTTLN